MNDDNEPRRNNDNLAELLSKEELDSYSVQELKSRKILLEQEIKRTEDKITFAKDHRSAADNLFK